MRGPFPLPPPERRRRSDVVVAVVITVAVAVTASVMWATSPHHGTVSAPAAAPVAAPDDAATVPAGFTQAWTAPSPATTEPVVAGPVVVTGDDGDVAGRDVGTGQVRWSYDRNLPLCAVGSGFPDHDGGRALALYRNGDWCSEMTSLHPDTGTRDRQSNPNVHPGTQLLDTGSSLVTATGRTVLEAMRSDLVETVEYGDVPTPRQVGRQPRPSCLSTGFAPATGRLAILQSCPGELTDRLTVIDPDGAESDKPEEQFSVPLTVSGATLVAASEDRVAVVLPNPPRLQVVDRSGAQVADLVLDVPAADVAKPPADGVVPVSGDDDRLYWWTGSRTVALDASDLTPLWTLSDTLGPGVSYAGRLLVPVRDGIDVVDPGSGNVERVIPVSRTDPAAPVRSAVLGDMLLEQRGPELVALRPSP